MNPKIIIVGMDAASERGDTAVKTIARLLKDDTIQIMGFEHVKSCNSEKIPYKPIEEILIKESKSINQDFEKPKSKYHK